MNNLSKWPKARNTLAKNLVLLEHKRQGRDGEKSGQKTNSHHIKKGLVRQIKNFDFII